MRIPGYYKLDLYIIRKFLGTFFFMIILLMFVVVIFDLSEKLDEFIENQAPPKAIIFDYFLNFIPYGCIIMGSQYCLFLYCKFFIQNSTKIKGTINLKNTKWEIDLSPIDQNSTSFIANNLPKAYLRHLIVSKEILDAQIACTRNLSFLLKLTETARNKINGETFSTWKDIMVVNLANRLLLTRKT